MNKTRFMMLVGVVILSLALVGIALAADNAQKPNPPVQVAFTGLPPAEGGVQNIGNSGVNLIDPDSFSPAGFTGDLCFNVHVDSPDAEYMDGFDFTLPADWVVNSVTDVPGTGCALGHTFGVNPGNVVFWYTNGMPTGCGDWNVGDYNFCANVTIPAGCSASWDLPWNYYGDTWGSPPHSTSGSELAFCELPGVYLIPDIIQAAGCNGIPQVHTLSLFNNTGADGIFDMTYSAPVGMATLEGPAQIAATYGQTVAFDVTLTPNVCNFDQIVATVDASGNDYSDQATITKDIVNVPSFAPVDGSSPSWGGAGYPRDGCTAMNADGDWVTYQFGDTTSFSGFWGYNTVTNTWYQPGPTNLPADRWAPDWAYDPATNLCYVTGGSTIPGGGDLNTAYVFDPVANGFTQLGNFTSIRDFHTSWVGTIDGIKYLCLGGGVNTGGVMVQATQCYDLSQAAPGAWNAENAQIPMLPTDAFGAADGILHGASGDQFWYVGGAISAGAILTDEARYFDDADNAWHLAGNTGFPRYRVEGDFFNGDFYQVGGSSGGFTPTPEVIQGHFDGANWVFTQMDSLASGTMDNVVGVTDTSVWSINGYNATGTMLVEHAVFCPLCTGPLSVVKDATAAVLPGNVIDYSVTINNTSDGAVAASMLDAIPLGTTFIPSSLVCNSGDCSYDAGLNAVVWAGDVGPAVKSHGIDNIGDSTMNFIDPTLFSPDGVTSDICFNVTLTSPDFEYLDRFDFHLPEDWTVNSVTDVPSTGCSAGHTFGVEPGNIVNWTTNGFPPPTGCGDWSSGTFNFCANVTVPAGCVAGWDLPWNIFGDGYGGAPHEVVGVASASCGEEVAPNPITISFQATAGPDCPVVVSNTAMVSSEGNPDVFDTADTNVYCSFAPDIVVSPLSLAAEQPPDSVTSQQLQICNEGPSPLDWSLTEVAGMKVTSVSPSIPQTHPNGTPKAPVTATTPAGAVAQPAAPINPQDVLWEQTTSYAQGAVSDDYPPEGWGAFSGDDFQNSEEWLINNIYTPGWIYFGSMLNASAFHWCIYPDAGGVPAGDPYSGGAYWCFSTTPTDPAVTVGGTYGGDVTLDVVAATGSALDLPAGSWWYVFYPEFSSSATDWYYWFFGDTTNLSNAMLIDPTDYFGGGYTSWTPWASLGVAYWDLAFRLEGTVSTVEPPNVLLVNADTDNFDGSPIQGFLQGYGDLGAVDLFDAINGTPTLAQLQAYDVVVTWSNYNYFNPTALGDVLADYVDTGGKVINSNFSMIPPGGGLAGRFVTENYTAMWGTGFTGTNTCLGTFDVSHPIMGGITNVCEFFIETGTYLTPGSSEVARWANNELFVAVKDNQTVVSMNAYVGASYQYTGQMPDVLHNAILWLAGGVTPPAGIPWLSEVPTSGTVEPFACTFVNVSFDSTGMVPGFNTGELDVNSNDPDTPVVPVDVSLNVLAAPDISITPNFLISTLLPNTQETQDLNVCNDGQTALDWSLAEVPGLKVNSVTPATAYKPVHPIALALDANGINAPTGPEPKAPAGDVSLILDDGSRENDIGIGGLQEFLWVNRFTPNAADFPFQINEVWIYFSSVGLVNVGDNIKIVFYENTTGGFDPAPGSNYLGGFLTTVQALDTWNVYTIPDGVMFNGPTGDAIIGVIGLEVPGSSYWPASIDQTTTQQRSWAGWWNVMPPPDPPLLPPDASWVLIDDYFPGNWMVRAYGTSGFDIPWASETPTSGSVQPGECTIVSVTFDSTGLEPLTYHGGLDFTSNDPDTPVFNVPLTLNVIAPDISVDAPPLDMTLFPNEVGTFNIFIGNIGTADLTWAITDGATWLSEDPTSGTVTPSNETMVVIYFDSTGLTPGEYTTDVVIASNDPDQPEITLPATLTVLPFESDLSIVKTASAEPVKVGDVFTYTLVVANAGPDLAMGVMVVDTLPDLVTFVSASAGCTNVAGVVTCDVGDLDVEDSVTLTIVVMAAGDGIASNTAVVSSESTDPNPDNNTSTVDTTINPAIFKFYLPIIQKH